MPGDLQVLALAVFCFFFLLVTVMGFWASRWQAGDLNTIDEWGLGGRRFGTWITWFLVGGDFYTAYTVIAVPALVYAVGAYGFFALPYTILVYPFIYAVMPKFWEESKRLDCVTAADYARKRFDSRGLELAVAVTSILATLPYIALQLVGMEVVLKAMGLHGEIPLTTAFIILAVYTYSSGLRAPALIAFVKDIMIYIVVIAAVIVIPLQLGGYAQVFELAGKAFAAKGPNTGITLPPGQLFPFATLALGSAFAAFMYPHTLTGIMASNSADVIRKNAIFLPAYTILLGLIALLGLMAHAAGIDAANASEIVPRLFQKAFPEWFVGFAYAAVAIGALVPAAVMSIGASNLFTRNIWKTFIRPRMAPSEETRVAKIFSLVVKVGALLFILLLPTKFAIDLQLLGGLWILQIFPTIVFGLFWKRLRAPSLLAGWFVGLLGGTTLVIIDGLKPVHVLTLWENTYGIYTGLLALILNIVVAEIVNLHTSQDSVGVT